MKAIVSFIFLCVAMLSSAVALAQTYPSGSLKIVVGFPAGGAADVLARVLADKLGQSWGQHVLVENQTGANGTIGTAHVAKSRPDGHTMLLAPAGFAVNPSLYPNLPFDSLRDLQPVTRLSAIPLVLAVHPSLPANSIEELIALAKARPGEINYASGGNGTPPHLAMELFKYMAGVDITHIPYQGGAPALQAALSGEVQVYFHTPSIALQYLQAGQVRALGVSTAERIPALPDIPTIAEAGVPKYEAENWFGLFVAGGTPQDIYMNLNAEVVRILNLPDMKERLEKESARVVGDTPDQFTEWLKEEVAKNSEIIKLTGTKLD